MKVMADGSKGMLPGLIRLLLADSGSSGLLESRRLSGWFWKSQTFDLDDKASR
jgi:hypothetical protein